MSAEKDIMRALDSLSTNRWQRFLMKWHLLGLETSKDPGDKVCIKQMRRQLEMPVAMFSLILCGWAGLFYGLISTLISTPKLPGLIQIGIAYSGVAFAIMALVQIRDARKVIWRKLIACEADLLEIGLFVAKHREVSPRLDQALTYLEARRVGENTRTPSCGDLVVLAHWLTYAYLEIQTKRSTQIFGHLN